MLQLLLFSIFSLLHPFYVSVTEIEQNPKTQVLQISSRIFFDDLERAIARSYKTKLDITKPADRKKADQLIAGYIRSHLKISANGRLLELRYVGYEIQEEAAWCYFEAEPAAQIKSLSIQNHILFEQHPEQINMIHVTIGGKRQSTKLDNPKDQAVFSY